MKRYSEFYHTETIKQYMAGDRRQRQWIIDGGEASSTSRRRSRAGSTSRRT